MSRIWQEALASLEERINPSYFDLWFRPIECTGVEEDEITLRAPNVYFKDWFSAHYLPVVLDEIFSQTQLRYRVNFQVEEAAPSTTAAPRVSVPPALPGDRTATAPAPHAPEASAAATTRRTEDPQDLLPSFTFDSFVVGPANQLAHAAARAAATYPAAKFNPVYIYGGVGLGKTHLLMAIGHELRRRNPSWTITYISCERFINEYIAALRPGNSRGDNRIDAFRHRYRDECDVLLIDDIQFLAGKERTQDEFFHTFNSLWQGHRQIVLTSDKFPHEIDNLEERLRSRFGWGLVADIQRPDLEMRIAILNRKAEVEGVLVPSEVGSYLAQNIRSNVRELEGALVRLAAYASLRHEPLSLELAQEALKDLLSTARAGLTLEGIVKEVAEHFRQRVTDLRGPRRSQEIAWPRQVAMYLAYRLLQSSPRKVSYPQLGSFFGGRDHTTVLSACRKVEKLRETDHSVAALLASLEQRLQR